MVVASREAEAAESSNPPPSSSSIIMMMMMMIELKTSGEIIITPILAAMLPREVAAVVNGIISKTVRLQLVAVLHQT